MTTLLIAVGIVLLTSAICSGTEASLFSLPVLKAREFAQAKRPGSRALLAIREHMSRPISTVVILNNVANIVGSIVVGALAAREFDADWKVGVFSGILTFLVIIFSEIVPKTLGERYADRIALVVAAPVLMLSRILTPLIWLIELITRPITHGEARGVITSESEIRLLAHIGHQEGVIDERESLLIRRALDLDKATARQLMTPRVAMTWLKAELAIDECRQDIINSQHSRIIVVGEGPDDVKGVVLKATLLTELIEGKVTQQVGSLARDVEFVPESASADQLLSTFQRHRQHIAVVVDEFAGVSGVVTLEDVLEVLTGEIVDETDRAVDLQALARKRADQAAASRPSGDRTDAPDNGSQG